MGGQSKTTIGEATMQLRAAVRQFDSTVVEQSGTTTVSDVDTDWVDLQPVRVDIPGDAQVSRSWPPVLRAGFTATGVPTWTLTNNFDANGNRTSLVNEGSGTGRYGSSTYGGAEYADNIFSTPIPFDALNRRVSFMDKENNLTTFGYYIDGRLAEIGHPHGSPALKTRNRYDLVGRLLESRVLQSSTELWGLEYGYNQASDRVEQTSRWSSGGNRFEYLLDNSGRLKLESINRFVNYDMEQLARGTLDRTEFGTDHKVRILGQDDDFSGSIFNLQKWEPIIGITETTSDIRQEEGLHMLSSRGHANRYGRVNPPGDLNLNYSNGSIYEYGVRQRFVHF